MPALKPLGPSTREERVALLLEAFEALLKNRLPTLEARLFLAGGGLQWLRQGGRLTRDFWRVDPERGSRRTVDVMAAQIAFSSSMTAKLKRIDEASPGRRVIRCGDDEDSE